MPHKNPKRASSLSSLWYMRLQLQEHSRSLGILVNLVSQNLSTSFQIILTLVSALAPASHRSAPFPSLNFYYSLTPFPSHRTRSHPLSGVLPSLVPYVTLFQSISSSLPLSLSLPSIALQSISGLIRKQPVLLTVTLALTLSRPCWGGSWFMPLNIFTHDLHRKLHRMLYSPRRDGST